MVIRKILSSILLAFLIAIIIPQSFGQEEIERKNTVLGETGGPVSIEWESTGTLYRIEVRRDGILFINTEQSESRLELNLAPGIYEYRITVLNPFGKDVTSSNWQSLTVYRARIPYFRVRTPLVVWEGETAAEFDIDSSNLRRETTFTLVDGEKRIDAEWTVKEESDSVHVDIDGLSPGSWDLEAVDPSGRTFVHPDALTIRPIRPPEIAEIDTTQIPNTGLVPIEINGEAFDPEMEITVKGPGGDLNVAAVNVENSNKAIIYLDLDGDKPGNYSMTIINPSGEKDSRKDILLIRESENPTKREKEHPRMELQVGFLSMVLFSPDEILFTPLGIEGTVGFHSGWTVPFFRGLGIETRGVFGMMIEPDMNKNLVTTCGSLDLTGYWRPLVRGRIAPVVFFGIGNFWSGYTSENGIKNVLFFRTGFAVDITRAHRIHELARVGINFQLGLCDEDQIGMVSIIMRRSFRM